MAKKLDEGGWVQWDADKWFEAELLDIFERHSKMFMSGNFSFEKEIDDDQS